MNLTETEKKCLILAFDRSAADGEINADAGRLVRLLRKRYADGYALIGDLESLPDRPRIDFHARHAAWLRRREIYGNVTLNFGKYRGWSLNEIPADYLIWTLQNLSRLSPSIREAISSFLDQKI